MMWFGKKINWWGVTVCFVAGAIAFIMVCLLIIAATHGYTN